MVSIPGVPNYPTVLDDLVSLVESANAAATTLTTGYTTGATSISVADNTLFQTSGLLTIGTAGLILTYTGKSGSTGFTGVARAATLREPNNPADTNVPNGSVVEQRVTSGSLGVLRSALIQVETLLGVRAAAAQSGAGRYDNAQWLTWRNQVNNADINGYRINASNQAEITPPLLLQSNALIKGPRPWVDVRAYGALGDDSTDDLAAINAAISAANAAGGGTVLVPLGIYRVSDAITMKSNVILEGAGWGSVLKEVTGNLSILALRDVTGVTVRNLRFVGTGTLGTAGRAAIWCAINASFGAKKTLIQNNYIDGVGTCGIVVADSDEVQVIDNQINTTQEHGLYLSSTTNSLIRGNSIRNAGLGSPSGNVSGIKIATVQHCLVQDNFIDAPLHAGIIVDGTLGDVVCDGNYVRNAGTHGLRITSSPTRPVDMVNNRVYSPGSNAVIIQGGDSHVVANNRLFTGAAGIWAIDLTGGTNHIVGSNVIDGWDNGLRIEAAVTGARVLANVNRATSSQLSNSGTGTLRDAGYDTTQKSYRFQIAAAEAGLVGLIYVNTADDALASGGTAELKFASQKALIAAGLTVGKVLRVRLRGTVTIDTTAGQTTTVRIKLGDATNATSGTTLGTVVFTHSGNNLTNLPWSIDCEIVLRSATTAWGGGKGWFASIATSPYTSSSVALLNGGGLGTATTIPNISTAHTVHVTGQPNDTGQVITLRTMTCEILN